ncbi:MAG TPA: SIMPL domain-containing protein [Actinomycetota bacterium]|nr:SIMPL domain-containing protein [Actinomycetota bacterium]
MTRRTWTVALVIVALVVLAVGARAMAQDGGGDGDRRTVTVTSTATVGSEPDEASVRLGIETTADDSAPALAENGAITDEVLAAVRDAGVDPADVRTESLEVFRRTIDRRTPRERRVYVADGTLTITVRDLDAVGAVIEAAVGAGATSVRGLRFEVSDPAEARASALEQAVQGARVKADAMASAAGASVAGVERIVEEGAARPVFEQYRAATLSAADDSAVAVVPPDELDTSVTVTVTWSLG